MTDGRASAAQRYKEIVAGLDEAAEAARDHDRERAAELGPLAAQRYTELLRSGERAALTRAGVALRWEEAVEALWGERWFLLRPRPEPDPRAQPEHLDNLDRAVDDALATLIAAIRRGRLSLRRG